MFIVNKDSWHYRFLIWYRMNIPADYFEKSKSTVEKDLPTDFCEYWRAVLLWPSLRVGFNLLVNILIVASSVFMISNVKFFAMTLGVALGCFAALAGLVAIIYFFSEYVPSKFKSMRDSVDGDAFIKTAIASHKEKFCTAVDYKDSDNV